jgi:hypothetical protein
MSCKTLLLVTIRMARILFIYKAIRLSGTSDAPWHAQGRFDLPERSMNQQVSIIYSTEKFPLEK